jgi:hypothetical protein
MAISINAKDMFHGNKICVLNWHRAYSCDTPSPVFYKSTHTDFRLCWSIEKFIGGQNDKKLNQMEVI